MKTKNLLIQLFTVLICIHFFSNARGQGKPELLFYKFDTTGTVVRNLASSPPSGTNFATLMGSLSLGSGGRCSSTGLIGSGNASSTDYLNTGWAPSTSGSWTISFITKNVQPSSTLYYIFGDANSGSFRCFTNGVAGANNWWLRGPLTDVPLNGAAIVAETMSTFVYDATLGNIKAYRNDTLVNTVSQGAISLNGSGPFKVIGYGTNVGLNNGGIIDNFRFYSRALSASEVADLLNCNFPNIVLKGNGATIGNGDNTPSFTDSTDFGNINPDTSSTKTYTIVNSGTADLAVSDIYITGADSSLFSIAGISLPDTIAPNDSLSFTLTFTPNSQGNKSATVNINSDDENNGNYSFDVTGNLCTAPVSFTQCPSDINKNVADSSCDTLVVYTATASGGSPTVSYTFSGATSGSGSGTGSGSIFNIGVTNVRILATNNCSVDSCKFTVSVIDNIPPMFTSCPSNVSMQTGQCSTTVNYTLPAYTENCGTITADSIVFNYTAGIDSFTVPTGISLIEIETMGAGGGTGATGGNGSNGGVGGKGSKASGTLSVTAGQKLYINVGGAGATPNGGYNGGGNGGSQNAGGGGGASDVRYPSSAGSDRIIVASGAGGGGRGGCESSVVTGAQGGNGDGNGGNGTDASTSGGFAGGGFGAVGSTFGAKGIGCSGFLGGDGTSGNSSGIGGTGGAGQACCCFGAGSIPGGGGGGGGYLGGGGGGGGSAGTVGCSGNDKGAGGGGAGGSSYTGGVNEGNVIAGVQSGNGQIKIKWGTNGGALVQTAGLPSGANFPLGTTTNMFVVTDLSGNTDTCTFTVTLTDTLVPFKQNIPDIIAKTNSASCDTTVNYDVLTPGASTTISYAFTGATTGSGSGSGSGNLFNLGVTNVQIITTDCRLDTCRFTITIGDDVKPELTQIADMTRTINGGCTARLLLDDTEVVGASPFQDSLWRFLLSNFPVTARMAPSLSGFTITGVNGIAQHPINGKYYAILKVSGVSGRVLATIDLSNAECTQIGNLGDNFASITFDPSGKLYGATGDGATVPEALYEINPTTAAKTLKYSMGNGGDGEIICFNPDDGFIYHWSGNGTVVFEKMLATNNSYTPTNIPISGGGGGEVFGALYQGGNQFLTSNISSGFRTYSTTGTVGSQTGSNPDDLRGVVYYNNGYSIDVTDNCPGTVTVTQISGLGANDLYPVGVTTNTFVATDAAGNKDTMSFTVTVNTSVSSSVTATQPAGSAYTGGVATNLYLGYGATLDTLKSIGLGSNVNWSPSTYLSCTTGCAKTIFTPTTAGTFTITASSLCGSKDITITVRDVRHSGTGTSNAKVYLCHKEPVTNVTSTQAVLVRGVPAHFSNHSGDKLGQCGMAKKDGIPEIVIEETDLEVTCRPNPFHNSFTLKFESLYDADATVSVYGITGNLLEKRELEGLSNEVELGADLPSGIYTVSFVIGNRSRVFKMIKVE